MVLLVSVLVFAMFGCAKQEGPKDEEAIKAVQAEIEGGAKGYTLKSPIVIVEIRQEVAVWRLVFQG